MTRKLLAPLFGFVALLLSCAVSAQVPNAGSPMVPNTAPGIQANLNSNTAPTAANDQTQGYSVGSVWENAGTGQIWVARSVATNAAVWDMLELSNFPGYIAGNWYLPVTFSNVSGGLAPGANSIRLFPAYIKTRVTVGALGMAITTLSGGGNVQAAIYANNPATGRPTGTALVSTSSMSTAATGAVNATISKQLEAGLYWFASNSDNATVVFEATLSTGATMSSLIGSATQLSTLSTTGTLSGLAVAQAFNTWPDLTAGSFTELNTSQRIPLVIMQISSVP